MSHIRHLRPRGCQVTLENSGLEQSTQIYHNPIKPADFTIICRLSQPMAASRYRPYCTRVVISKHVPQPGRYLLGHGAGMLESGEGHTASCWACRPRRPSCLPLLATSYTTQLHYSGRTTDGQRDWQEPLRPSSPNPCQAEPPRTHHKANLRGCHLLLSCTAHSQFSPKRCFYSCAANTCTFTSEEEENRWQNVIFSKERMAILSSSIVQGLYLWPVSA